MLKRSKSKLKPNTALKSRKSLVARKTIKKIGKKTKEWSIARKEAVEYLSSMGIVSCEGKMEGCTRYLFLTLAHSKKRRHIQNSLELAEIALLCQHCHNIIEGWKESDMEVYVKKIVQDRGV